MRSPRGRSPGWPGPAEEWRIRVAAGCSIPSTSPRATGCRTSPGVVRRARADQRAYALDLPSPVSD